MIIDRKSPVPSYFQLQTWIQDQIEVGEFKPGERIPTEAELNKKTGLARATIRQAIQNLVNAGYLVRKRGQGTFVINKWSQPSRQTIIGLLIPDIRHGYAPILARGVQDEAAMNRHSLILCDTDDLVSMAEFHAERLIETGASGIIFVPTAGEDAQNITILEKFRKNNMPVVLLDRIIPGFEADLVTVDNIRGAYEMTEYLIKNGHRRIAITLSTRINTERDRLEGYRKALEDNGIPVDTDLVMNHEGRFSDDHYRKVARRIFDSMRDVTAIFAGHDRIALAIFSEAQEKGISIPGDVSVVGFDDLDFTVISLTTMHQPIYEMGQESMKLMMKRLHGPDTRPERIIFNSYLVERTSVKNIN